jgi:hypothetical protein
MRMNLLFGAAFTLLATNACGLKLTTSLDESVENIGCTLRSPIYLGSSEISALYGRHFSGVELDSSIQTETINPDQRFASKSLSFFEIFYRSANNEQRTTGRVGARLDVGTDSVGFANLYDGIRSLSLSDNTHNESRIFKTSFFGFEDTANHSKETWELDVVIKGRSVTAIALTVPVMTRNTRTAFTSYTFSGRNQKLCVTEAR